jgi:hypothetical protein
MVRRLTQEEIDKFGLIDAVAGDIATPEDLEKIELPTLPKQEVLAVDPEIEEIKNQALNAINQPVPINNQPPVDQNIVQQNTTAGNRQLLDLLALTQHPQEPVDPFENLSKNQRRMLAFAGIRDAGLALQGKEGSSVANLMNQFTERADIERKRKAAAAQRQMLGTFLSGSAAGTLDPQSIINAMALGALPPEAGNAMLAQMEKARLQQMADEAVVGSGAGALEDLERLRKTIDEGGMVTGFSGWLFSKIPFSEASAARTVADTLRSGMALGALRELKAGGATLGSVSAPELELLESAIARLNLNVPRKKVLEQMATIERHYKDAVRRSYKKASEEEKRGFDVYFGGTTPAWVLDPSAPDPTKTIDPTIDDLSEEEKRRLGLD